MYNNTLCVLPFSHFSIKPNGDVKPCCRFLSHHPDHTNEFHALNINNFSSADAVLESEVFKNLRNNMLAGKTIPGCSKCYQEEAASGSSMRIGENIDLELEKHKNGEIKLRFIEVAFGNYCNLACRTCTSNLSTSWYADDKIISGYYSDRNLAKQIFNVKFNWKPGDFEFVEKIKFTGGEPMLHPDFIKFIDVIIESGYEKNITLDVFTNTSWVPKDKVLSRILKFKRVKLWLSVDGTGELNDYIRHNAVWSVVESSTDKWLDIQRQYPDKIGVILTPTVCIYNINKIENLIDWWVEKNKAIHAKHQLSETGDVVLSILTYPLYLNIMNYPNKKKIIDKLTTEIDKLEPSTYEFHVKKRTYTRIVNTLKKFLTEETIDLNDTIKYTKDLDNLRKQSLSTVNNELYNDINEYLIKNGTSYNNIQGNVNV